MSGPSRSSFVTLCVVEAGFDELLFGPQLTVPLKSIFGVICPGSLNTFDIDYRQYQLLEPNTHKCLFCFFQICLYQPSLFLKAPSAGHSSRLHLVEVVQFSPTPALLISQWHPLTAARTHSQSSRSMCT